MKQVILVVLVVILEHGQWSERIKRYLAFKFYLILISLFKSISDDILRVKVPIIYGGERPITTVGASPLSLMISSEMEK